MQEDRPGKPQGSGNAEAILKRWPLAAGLAILGAVGAAAYTALAAPVYEARTVLLLPYTAPSSGLAGLRGDSSPIAYLGGIINSGEMASRLSQKLGLPERVVDASLSAEPLSAAQQITLRFRNGDKAKALAALAALQEELNDISDATAFTVAKSEAEALGRAVKDRERELQVVQREFQAQYRRSKTAPSLDPNNPTVSPWVARLKDTEYQLGVAEQKLASTRQKLRAAGQSAVQIPVDQPQLKQWRERLDDLNYQLSIKQVDLGPKAAEVIRLTQQIEVTREALQKEVQKYLSQVDQSLSAELITLEVSRLTLTWQRDFTQKMADAAPDEIADLEQLAIRVTSLRGAVAELRRQYESKRVQAEVGSVSWSVLQAPVVDPQPVNKRYTYNGAAGAAAGAMAGLALAILLAGRRPRSA